MKKINRKQSDFRSIIPYLSQLPEHQNKILQGLEESNSVGVIYSDFLQKCMINSATAYFLNKLNKIEINGNTQFISSILE